MMNDFLASSSVNSFFILKITFRFVFLALLLVCIHHSGIIMLA